METIGFCRRAGLAVTSVLFVILLFASANSTVSPFVFANSNKVKQIVHDSGVYDTATNALIDESTKNIQENSGELDLSVPINEPAIQQAARDALTPMVLQTNTETFIDSMYHWLDGETTQPDFRLDLSQSKQAFVDGVGRYAENRAATLPACSAAQLQALDTTDVFAIPCMPPGVTATQIGERARAETANQDFLKDPVITPDTFSETGKQNPLTENTRAPEVFQASKNFFWIFSVLSVAIGTAIVFLHINKRRGLLRVGTLLIGTAILLGLLTSLANLGFNRLRADPGDIDSPITRQIFIPLLTEVWRSGFKAYLSFAAALLVIGTTILVVRHLTKANAETTEEPAPKKRTARKKP